MAALNRPTKASYEVHESVRVDTGDNEDHTFCGVMFPIKAKEVLPVEKIVVHSLAVRGQLGPMTVWVSNNEEQEEFPPNREYAFQLHERHWKKIYEKTHAPSQREYCELRLDDNPIVIKPGHVRVVYIHSKLQGDEAIVYDNSRMMGLQRAERRRRSQPAPRYEDSMVQILSAKSHLSCEPFGQVPIWGWGNAWRDHREFVGRIEYGCVFKLWNPELNASYGNNFRKCVETLLACQRRRESPVSILPDECIFYILNMCRWDFFGDNAAGMHNRRKFRKKLKRKIQQLLLEQKQLEEEEEEVRRKQAESAAAAAAAAAPSTTEADEATKKPAAAATVSAGATRSRETTGQAADRQHDDDKANEGDDELEEASDEDEDFIDDGAGTDDAEDMDAQDASQRQDDAAMGEDDDDDDDSSNNDGAGGGNDDDEGGGESDESEWERRHGYRADTQSFIYRDVTSSSSSSDDDDMLDDAHNPGGGNNNWFFGRHLARVHVLRALAGAVNPQHQDGNNDNANNDDNDNGV